MADNQLVKNTWTVVGIIALTAIILFILKATFNVLLLMFAGTLIAVYFRGLADLINRKLNASSGFSLALSFIFTILLLAGFLWFTGNSIQQQFTELRETLPSALETFKQKVYSYSLGRQAIEKITSEETKNELYDVAQTFFRSSFGFVGDIYIVLILGLFFTASPGLYVDGFIKLIPSGEKKEAKRVINKIGVTLAKWLKGQLFSMLIVMVMTAIGLLIMGVPMALALALIAGLLTFIPNFGPLIAMILAALIGFMQDTTTGLLVISLYLTVQIVESNIITPQIQKRLINIPPALIILAQLFMGVLAGGWGLLLAMPVVALVMVIVQEVYIKKQTPEIES